MLLVMYISSTNILSLPSQSMNSDGSWCVNIKATPQTLVCNTCNLYAFIVCVLGEVEENSDDMSYGPIGPNFARTH
jgi:hypothetical protein